MNHRKRRDGHRTEHWQSWERRRDSHLTSPQTCPTNGVHLSCTFEKAIPIMLTFFGVCFGGLLHNQTRRSTTDSLLLLDISIFHGILVVFAWLAGIVFSIFHVEFPIIFLIGLLGFTAFWIFGKSKRFIHSSYRRSTRLSGDNLPAD